MNFGLILDVRGAVAQLQAMQRRLRDLRPAWRSLLPYLRRATQSTFASQGGRIGDAWAPLSQEYAKWKAVRFPGKPILRASDAMFESLVNQTGDSVVEIEPRSFRFGTRDRKAKYHQQGTRKMPRRRILDVTDEDRRQIKQLVREHLSSQSRVSGFERA